MPKLIEWIDILVIALLFALGSYVAWKAIASQARVQPKSAAIEQAVGMRQCVPSEEAAAVGKKLFSSWPDSCRPSTSLPPMR